VCRGIGRLQVEIGNGELRAILGENNGYFLTHAAGCAGDDGDFNTEDTWAVLLDARFGFSPSGCVYRGRSGLSWRLVVFHIAAYAFWV